MDFEEILNQWDRSGGVYHKEEVPAESSAEKRRRLLKKKCDATIDLHGLTRDEAWEALEDFFAVSRSRELEKVLVIHGKGSQGTPVLKKTVQDFIARCPAAGESGHSNPREGGSGATWVLLK
ncbi:MAG: Smr/MutS family protein [Treponema sp.]|jgi:DNA-nicking Smr family endonuclease|nr:Smr/MutS family protein [Treponema sp.]